MPFTDEEIHHSMEYIWQEALKTASNYFYNNTDPGETIPLTGGPSIMFFSRR